MNLSPVESRVLAILAIFETGKPNGYSAFANAEGDTGGVSLGLFQASLNSGNAGRLLRAYTDAGGQLDSRWVDLAELRDSSLDCPEFRAEWEAVCDTELMQLVQQEFFYTAFIRPAVSWCSSFAPKMIYPLSLAVVADSRVHGSLVRLAVEVPPTNDEMEWVELYLVTRRTWLATHHNYLLRRTVYRPDFFLGLVEAGNWGLEKPFICRGWSFE